MFKNHEDDSSQKLSEPNIWLLVNHTKPANTKKRAGTKSKQLQNNTPKRAMSNTINRVINSEIIYVIRLSLCN